MKKVLLMFLGILFLTGCTSSKLYEVEFDANATTGYSWSYELNNEGIIKIVTDKYVSEDNPDSIVGVGGKQIYEIEGLKEGEVTITFIYSQAWDSESEPAQKEIYNLKVDKDLNIIKVD